MWADAIDGQVSIWCYCLVLQYFGLQTSGHKLSSYATEKCFPNLVDKVSYPLVCSNWLHTLNFIETLLTTLIKCS